MALQCAGVLDDLLYEIEEFADTHRLYEDDGYAGLNGDARRGVSRSHIWPQQRFGEESGCCRLSQILGVCWIIPHMSY